MKSDYIISTTQETYIDFYSDLSTEEQVTAGDALELFFNAVKEGNINLDLLVEEQDNYNCNIIGVDIINKEDDIPIVSYTFQIKSVKTIYNKTDLENPTEKYSDEDLEYFYGEDWRD